MSVAISLVLAAIIVGVAYTRGLRANPEAERSNAGWYGLGLLALLFAGLWASGQAGNEPAAYGFGIAIFFALAVMLLVGVASAFGRAMRKRKGQTR
jgi:hypothetical protein